MNTGDLEPDWTVDIVAADTTVDFTAVQSWKFTAYRETVNGKVDAFPDDTAPTVTPGANGYRVSVAHAWETGETDTAGILHAVPIATWPGGREQSFPGASLEIVANPS